MNALQLIRHGQQFLAERKLNKAEEVCQALMAQQPDLPPVRYFACEVATAKGDFPAALAHVEKALEKDGNAAALHLMKANVLLLLRRGIEAQQSAQRAATLKNDDAAIHFQAAQVFMRADNPKGAEPFFLKAQSIGAASPQFLFELAKNRYYCGDTNGAADTLEQFLKLVPNHGEALLLRSKLATQTEASNHIAALEQVLTQDLVWKDEVSTAYALAKECEDVGRYDDAFAAISRGASVQRSHLRYQVADETANMADIASAFTKEAFDAITAGSNDAAPIFIVGMPRTGTTLAERMLSRADNVYAAGELNDFSDAMRTVINRHIAENSGKGLSPLTAALEADYSRMGDIYVERVRSMKGAEGRFIDKLPFNFLYCGLIKKALPNAKIIHLVRDPMDTCFAVYKTLFNMAYFFSYDLNDIAEYYSAYTKLMAHWHAIMPGDILDVSYEALVKSPTEEGKRMAEHCGLKWSDDMAAVEKSEAASTTASAAQVRERIYTSSIGNWRNFETHLKPLQAKLGLLDG
ncbi:tetratricopeptide repeat-containing sulfotransferase family protein [Kordiimonas gwangyangensis]|uniref:tetratricopeptide repeat-containing sulfotransferase family protein n=1 Tax=Kordiimonas gwangyangensis TaxID=288022 RepID=UPI00036DAFC4|nr:sulfotransferase [Kordiimonas gwangyangensis]